MRRLPSHLGVLLAIALASLALVLSSLGLATGYRGTRFDLLSGRRENYIVLLGREIYKADLPSPLADAYKKYVGPLPSTPNWLVTDWHPLIRGGASPKSPPQPGDREALISAAAEVLADCAEGRPCSFKIPTGAALKPEARKQLIERGLELLGDTDNWIYFPEYMGVVQERLASATLPASELDFPSVQEFMIPKQTGGLNFQPYALPPMLPQLDMHKLLQELEQQFNQHMQKQMNQAQPWPPPGGH